VLAVAILGTGGVAFAIVSGEGFKTTSSMLANIPRGSDLHDAYEELSSAFGAGKMWPYTLLIVPPADSGGIFVNTTWNTLHNIVIELADNPKLYQTSLLNFNFVFAAAGLPLPWSIVAPCAKNLQDEGCSPLLRNNIQQFVSPDMQSTYGYIFLPWDTIGAEGQDWLTEMRDRIKELEKEFPGFEIHLGGTPTIMLDQSAGEMAVFPYMILGVLLMAFLVLGVAFRSLLIPMKSVVSIVMTQGFVYGLAVLVYEQGAFDWMGIAGLSSNLHGIQFYMPVAVFAIIVGLCLDYDIFLLTRTQELCEEHDDNKAGIQEGLAHQGGVIGTAGIIMAFAFGGLLFSNIMAVNQLGFFLVFGALYDTFVSCWFISPCVMSLLGDLNWWPGPLFRKLKH
jgi:uncharacterized membrane protein YdfJ with MMPL/SSD domain